MKITIRNDEIEIDRTSDVTDRDIMCLIQSFQRIKDFAFDATELYRTCEENKPDLMSVLYRMQDIRFCMNGCKNHSWSK